MTPSPPDPPHPETAAPRRSFLGGRLWALVVIVTVLVVISALHGGPESSEASHASAGATAAGDAAGPEAVLQREWPLAADGRLELGVHAGDVTVVPGSGRGVRAVVELRRGGRDDLDELRWIEEEVGPDRVVVQLRGPEERRGWFGSWRRSGAGPVKAVRLEVPVGASLALSTGLGDVSTAEGLSGPLEVSTGAGDVAVAGPCSELTVRTGAGDVEAAACHGPVEVRSGAGDVAIAVREERASVRSGAGTITVRGSPSATDLNAGAGDVHVVLERVLGPVEARTGMGSIDVVVPGGAPFHVQGRSGMGTVRVRASAIQRESRGVSGALDVQVGDGGPALQLRTGAGSITVREAPTAP